MADAGTRAADNAQAAMERKMRRIYRQAQREIIEKLNAHTQRMYALDAQKRADVESGKITPQQYKNWLIGQQFTQKQWKDKVDSVATTLLYANQQANAIVEGEKRAVFGENATYAAYEMEHGMGRDLSFSVYDSATVTKLLREDPELLPRRVVNGQKDKAWNRQKISAAVTHGIIQGESIPQIAKRIAKQTASSNMTAMTRYARTAMTSAQNAGRMEAMHHAQEMGIKVQKKWLATLDNRTRDAHAMLDGQVQDVDKPFQSELGPIMFPGDPSADPGNVYNCRCTLQWIYPEYVPKTAGQRRDNISGELIKDMTYAEWKAANGEEIITVQSTGIESLRKIAEGSTDKYDFWGSLDENQQAVFKASGLSLDEAYVMLHGEGEALEWKPANPGSYKDFSIKYDYSDKSVNSFIEESHKNDGWMAEASTAGTIRVREGGLGDAWEEIMTHELGHQLTAYNDELAKMVLYNPDDVLGRYNIKLGGFIGMSYNPEESFAESVKYYRLFPDSLKKRYPKAYNALDEFFKASPSAVDFIDRGLKEYRRRFME